MVYESIKAYLEANSIAVSDVARATCIDERDLSEYLETGEGVDFAQYTLICRHLGVPVETFMGDDGPDD